MGRMALLVALAAAMLVAACEDDFSPKAEFHEEPVVFCVLDDAQPYQTVLLFRSYDAQLGVQLRPLTPREVQEADVRVLGGGETFVFQDTVLTAADGSTRHAWINHALRPRNERSYRLEVRIPGEDLLTGQTTMPSRMYVRAARVRPDTGRGLVRVSHGVTGFTVPPEGYYYRAWTETWKLLPGGDTVKPRIEIPLYMSPARDEWIYTAPSREDEVLFRPDVIEQFMNRNESDEDSVIARRLYLHGYGMEEHFYTYYKLVRGFDDPVTVRLDLPDISFIDGGLGFFGAMTVDSSSSTIYSYIRF